MATNEEGDDNGGGANNQSTNEQQSQGENADAMDRDALLKNCKNLQSQLKKLSAKLKDVKKEVEGKDETIKTLKEIMEEKKLDNDATLVKIRDEILFDPDKLEVVEERGEDGTTKKIVKKKNLDDLLNASQRQATRDCVGKVFNHFKYLSRKTIREIKMIPMIYDKNKEKDWATMCKLVPAVYSYIGTNMANKRRLLRDKVLRSFMGKEKCFRRGFVQTLS